MVNPVQSFVPAPGHEWQNRLLVLWRCSCGTKFTRRILPRLWGFKGIETKCPHCQKTLSELTDNPEVLRGTAPLVETFDA